ncbi:MAG TPA: TOBE domain-containing protein [Candidatus Caccocola faecipullorum]|nr:TOBE domain-containing protein [Candidatus Caccocola faecipullorum]
MNLSARNQLKATVAAVKKGAVNDEVSLRLADGTMLTSIITETSCENLGLKEGVEAYAVIKATNVMIGDLDDGGLKLSARNQLKGTVEAVKDGMVNCEVDVVLAGGEKVTSVITMASAKRLGLAAGKEIRAIIKASDIMVGVKA